MCFGAMGHSIDGKVQSAKCNHSKFAPDEYTSQHIKFYTTDVPKIVIAVITQNITWAEPIVKTIVYT